ncbi:hypothetical protein Tco_0292551, partial [Tanacetum coccineum]
LRKIVDCGMSSTVKIGLGYGIKSNAEVLGYELIENLQSNSNSNSKFDICSCVHLGIDIDIPRQYLYSQELNSGDDQLRLRWMMYLVVLADAAESVRDAIGFKYCLASSSREWTK